MKKSTSNQPSANEIRLRGELDRARRELMRLKKSMGAESEPKRPSQVMSTIPVKPAPPPEPEPVVEAAPEVAADESKTPAAASATPEALAEQVRDLTKAKQRLSRLYFMQLEENRKRAEKLHQVLENIGRINAELDLDALLQRLAATIRQSLGFRGVMIRLRAPDTPTLRAHVFASERADSGLATEQQDVSVELFMSWLREEHRISRSYYSRTGAAAGIAPAPGNPAEEEWDWTPQDVLLVPLFDRSGELAACVSVDDPEDGLVPPKETVELLEIYCHHAAVAIENARLVFQLEIHSRDLEEAQRVQGEMLQLKSNFVSTISHELRTPLAAIRAFVDTLMASQDGELTAGQVRHFLSVINDESQRLSRLIESVLDINRFDSGMLHVARQAVDMTEVIQETVLLLDPVAQVGQVTLKLDTRCADTRVDASRDQMRQLALHLGSNAVKFTPPGGTVTFTLSGDARDVGLEVADNGIGIPQDSLERVFERFYQVDSSLVRRYGGTGLGLAICKSIVEWHNGRIHAESEPGNGSRFKVKLPRRSVPRVVVNAGPSPEAGAGDILRLAVEMVAEVTGAHVVSLMCPGDDNHLMIRAAMGLDDEIVRLTRVPIGLGVAGSVAQNRKPIVVSGDDVGRHGVKGSGRDCYRSRTFMCVPIERGNRLLGVLNVTEPVLQEPYGEEDCQLLQQLAERIAIAWDQILDAHDKQVDVADTANALRHLVRHLERGRRNAPDRMRLASALAREIGLGEEQIASIGFAASVHDVGMRTLGEQIERAGSLSDDQRAELRRHPEFSADILAPLEPVGDVRDMILAHHERWDGSGYPNGLEGEAIPVGARILAVVDAFESMTVGRPHREAVSRDEAIEEIERLKGKQFDPVVVAALPHALERLERDMADTPNPKASASDTGR